MTAQGDLTPFADAAKISTYAQVPMAWAVAEGLIQGISEDTDVYKRQTLYLYGHPDRKHGGHRRLFQ